MSKTVVATVALGVLVLIGAALWWAGLFDDLTSRLDLDILRHDEEVVEEPQAPQAEEPASELSTGDNSSDEALDDDLEALDAQMSAYNETSSELDSSLNDQPVEQDSGF